MSVHDARPGDFYQDKSGRMWVVRSYCGVPTVSMERVIPLSDVPLTYSPDRFSEYAEAFKSGGVTGLMWEGFVKMSPAKPTTGE